MINLRYIVFVTEVYIFMKSCFTHAVVYFTKLLGVICMLPTDLVIRSILLKYSVLYSVMK